MERAKIIDSYQTRREVTSEIMFLAEAREDGEPVGREYDKLSTTEAWEYVDRADVMWRQGIRPSILDDYEKYDYEPTDLSQNCIALAEELFSLKRPNSWLCSEEIVVKVPAARALAELRSIKVDALINSDDTQLAIPSDGEYYPVLDIKKRDSKLLGVDLSVWSQEVKKYVLTNDPEVPYNYPVDCLVYPSTEKSHDYRLTIRFKYEHPELGCFGDDITLAVGDDGDLRMYNQVWAQAYVEMGYVGHEAEGREEQEELDGIEDGDIAEFVDLIAKWVGDQPEAVWQYEIRKLREYINTVPSEMSREYLQEWANNTNASSIRDCLKRTRTSRGKTLAKALRDGRLASEAHQILVSIVDNNRTRRNALAADKEYSQMLFSESIPPWCDSAARQT